MVAVVRTFYESGGEDNGGCEEYGPDTEQLYGILRTTDERE